jgi:hypothetical protein
LGQPGRGAELSWQHPEVRRLQSVRSSRLIRQQSGLQCGVIESRCASANSRGRL